MNRNNTLTRQLLFCLSFGLLPLLNANTSSLQASKPDAPKNQKKIYQKGWIDFNKNGKKDIYEDPSQPIDKRVEDLLKQMTVEEKTCQLGTIYGYGAVLKDTLPTDEWKTRIWKDGIGNIDEHLKGEWKSTSLDFPYSNHAEAMNKGQPFFVEETRLGIPADLKEIVKEDDVSFLAESAFADACCPGNPRDTSVCPLYTSAAADEPPLVALGARRAI